MASTDSDKARTEPDPNAKPEQESEAGPELESNTPTEPEANRPLETQPTSEPTVEATPTTKSEQENSSRRIVVMIADDGREPSGDPPEHIALGTWAAVSAPWHPSLLARLDTLPTIEGFEAPTDPLPGEIRVIAAGMKDRLSESYQTLVDQRGAVLMEADVDRDELVRHLAEILEPGLDPGPLDDSTALDFLALGTARWWLRDLTIGMEHVDCLDLDRLSQETLAGAQSWVEGDRQAATNRLRAAFELLTESRERFYPVDSYLLDLCLLDVVSPPGVLNGSIEARIPFTILAQAKAIENFAGADTETVKKLWEGVSEGWADIIGGPFEEVDECFRPVESILWQFRKGAETYRKHLDDRTVETLASRRFGLYPMRPQLAKRFGFRFALHLGFDAGKFPIPKESKRLWEAPDGSSLEALTRVPVGADRPAEALRIAWKMARSMRDDHVATLALVHWPDQAAPWYFDLRRIAGYSPVLGRWSTLSDYFHLTDRPFDTMRHKADEYLNPYLDQAIAASDAEPITRRTRHYRLRARLDALQSLRALATALTFSGPPPLVDEAALLADIEDALEVGRYDEVLVGLEELESTWAEAAARGVVGDAVRSSSDTDPPAGYLVVNPLGIARRVEVLLPDAEADLVPTGPLRATQLTAEGLRAVVTLPAFGYAWVPRANLPEANLDPTPPGNVSVKGRVLRNESLSVEIDEKTGGIRALMATNEDSARIGQQLVMNGLGLRDPKGKELPSRMQANGFEVEYAGPALVQAVSRGILLHPKEDRPMARFLQRYRLRSGRPIVDLEIELSDLDPTWLETLARGPAWTRHLACRWAWPDSESQMRRASLLGMSLTESERPETPEAIDVTARRRRAVLLFGGLAHHQKHGQRMLDTLLIAGREKGRSFHLGVALDLEQPHQAALDLIAPVHVVPTRTGPPRTGPTGWFYQLDCRSVAVTSVQAIENSEGGQSLIFHLLETAGRPARCRLRLFRNPISARQTDFNQELIVDLYVEGDTVHADLTPHELARVEVSLG